MSRQEQFRNFLTTFYNLTDIGHQMVQNIASDEEKEVQSDNGPFNNIPREILFKIFSYLNLYSLVQCSQVSKLFKGVASDPLHYAEVNLKPMFYCVTNDTLKYLFSRTHYLQRLDISWCGNYGKMSPKVLRSFLCGRGLQITSLIMSNCHVVTQEVFGQLGNSCPNLEELNLSNCHTLDVNAMVCPENMSRLRSLYLYRTNILTAELKHILLNNPLSECLDIGSCSKVDADVICTFLSKHNRKLKGLDLWRHLSLTSRGVAALSHLTELVELDLGWCSNVDANTGCIISVVKSCQKISKLFLTAHRQTSDREILAIQDSLTELRYLNIMGTRNVSTNAIEDLAKTLTDQILLLDIGYCEQLEDQEFLSRLMYILPNCHVVSSFNQS
jgi:F-box/leucine-rich repeat protein 4